MKKKSLSAAKKKAWEAFSIYIRVRDSLITTGTTERCVCVTCAREYPTRGVGCIQAGHFLGGRHGAVLLSEEGVHGQCYGCNVGRNGNHAAYTLWMIDQYGRDFVDQMVIDSKKTVKRKIWDYELLEKTYKAKTDALLSNSIVKEDYQSHSYTYETIDTVVENSEVI